MEERIFDIVGKQFSGNQISAEEELILSEWLKSAENVLVYESLRKTWEITGYTKANINADIDVEWNRFKSLSKNKPAYLKLHLRTVLALAASIIILIGVFSIYRPDLFNKKITIATTNDKTEFMLPDKSKVWLNKNSTLSYSKKFGKNSRQISFDGEAYFEVSHSAIPFIIFSPGNVKTQVLGTSFNLRAFKTDSVAELTVITGKVAFGEKETSLRKVIIKNQQAIINTEKNTIKTFDLKNQNAICWKTGIVTFNNSPLNKVSEDILHHYGIKISLPETYLDLQFSGKFVKPTPEEIAEIIGTSFNLNYSVSNQNIVFNQPN